MTNILLSSLGVTTPKMRGPSASSPVKQVNSLRDLVICYGWELMNISKIKRPGSYIHSSVWARFVKHGIVLNHGEGLELSIKAIRILRGVE